MHQKISFYTILLCTLLCCPYVFGQPAIPADQGPLSTTQQMTVSTTKVPAPRAEQKSANKLSISLSNQSYLQSTELSDSSEQVFNLKDSYYNYLNGNKKVEAGFIFGGYANNQALYLAVPQLYFQYTVPNSNNLIVQDFSIGRKLNDSSKIDEKFSLGLTNSFFTQDFIHFQSQGLIGLHHELSSPYFGISLSALPIYLPNQGPTIKEVNGKIRGSNRWVKKPPEKFAFNDKNKEIIYSIQYDQVAKLVFSPGAQAQIRIGKTENNIHLISSFSKRPLNEPILERETYADLNVVGNVNLVPNIIYAETLTTDLRFKNEKINTAASFITDRPENKTAKEYNSIQTLEGITGYALTIEYSSLFLSNREFTLGFSMADFQGGEIQDLNSDGSNNLFTFTKQRIQYSRPIQFSAGSDVYFLKNGRAIKAKMNWLYDRKQKGTVLTSELFIPALMSMNAKLGVEVIGTEEQKTEDYGFLQQFQSNDRVYGGLEYVF